MPLTKSGEKVLKELTDKYGEEKGRRIFYSMINEKKKGSEKWHENEKRERSRGKQVHYNS